MTFCLILPLKERQGVCVGFVGTSMYNGKGMVHVPWFNSI